MTRRSIHPCRLPLAILAGFGALIACGMFSAAATPARAEKAPAARKKVVLIAGKKSHGPVGNGIHDYGWSARLLKVMLDNSNIKDRVKVEVHLDGWPGDPRTLEDADTIMVISDGRDGDKFEEAPHLASPERVRFVDRQMKRGCGLLTFHFSTFTPQRYGDKVLRWSGGYFQWETGGKRQWYSAISTVEAEVKVGTPGHPVARGLEPFKLREEFYYNIRFNPGDKALQPIWVVPALPGREPDGRVVAWARERGDGGRGFGTTAGHFYDNWKHKQFRKMILNAIAWTAHVEVPTGGVEARYYTHDEIRAAERVPVWRLTTLLLIDHPPASLAFGLQGREEATQAVAFDTKVGNWDPRTRITAHATLPRSGTGWRFFTGVHDWPVSGEELEEFRHHVFIVDRPAYHQPGGKEKERVLRVALSSDVVGPGAKVRVRWRLDEGKGLPALKEARLAAFVQQAPSCADEKDGWEALRVEQAREGHATLMLPASLKPGLAWLRIGLAEGKARPTDRLLAEVRLVVTEGKKTGEKPAPRPREMRTVEVGKPAKSSHPSQVPSPWRKGVFLRPQSISAVDVSADGRSVGVTTMAFRHDRNFFVLSDQGKVQWGRYVQPWAPFQAAVLPRAGAFGVGLAYSRFTDPSPTVSLFRGEKAEETALVDGVWDMGWLRYGQGDWRTGWPASVVGDLIVRAHDSVFTVFSHDGAWRYTAAGRERYPLAYQRPFRMSASADGHVLAFGYLVPDVSRLDARTRQRLRLPPALLAVRNALTSGPLWAAGPMRDARPVPRPPEPADDFPDMAEDFNMKPLALVPFRVAASAALGGDGATAAVTEYGGWFRVKRERGIGSWNPDHPVPFCPRQRGWLRVFGALGEELARAELPAEGLFDVRVNRQGDTLWCVPTSWFARGLAGCPWLPTDVDAHTVFVYDLHRKAWVDAWRFPDAVSDLDVHPDGERALVSCWDGKVYLLRRDGAVQARVDVGGPARVRWSAGGDFAVLGTQGGEVWGLDGRGRVRWKTALPVAKVPPLKEPLRPVFEGVPIYSVGRVGTEHAYVGDIWLIKTKEGGILVDTGGTSAIPLTWQRLKAAGVDPKEVRYVLLSHSHGDHAGAAYLWRTQGATTVAPATAGLTVTWLMPTWSDYSIWVPAPIDRPLPLKRAGDEAEVTLCGLRIKAVFVPGHSFDSVLYVMEHSGKRVVFTGDIGFEGGSHILHRCWGDREKALVVAGVVRTKILPLRPDHVFTGHGPRQRGTAFLEDLLKRTEDALAGPRRK